MKDSSMYAGLQSTHVYNLAGSTVVRGDDCFLGKCSRLCVLLNTEGRGMVEKVN